MLLENEAICFFNLYDNARMPISWKDTKWRMFVLTWTEYVRALCRNIAAEAMKFVATNGIISFLRHSLVIATAALAYMRSPTINRTLCSVTDRPGDPTARSDELFVFLTAAIRLHIWPSAKMRTLARLNTVISRYGSLWEAYLMVFILGKLISGINSL